MTATIHSTTKVVNVSGVDCRIWEGVTENGIPLYCYIALVAVYNSQDCSQFEAELEERRAPSVEVQAIPLRLVL